MSLEFDTPPLTRRERREREEQLIKSGLSSAEAAVIASGNTGVIDLPPMAVKPSTGSFTPPVLGAPVTTVEVEHIASIEPVVPTDTAQIRLLSRREIRARQAEQADRQGGIVEDAAEEAEAVLSFEVPGLAEQAVATPDVEAPVEPEEDEPVAEPVVRDEVVVELVEQLFSQQQPVEPTAVAEAVSFEELIADDGPMHWTEGLNLPINLDPSDPASVALIPALASDTNTIVLDELPEDQALTTQTGGIDLVVTNSILLPTQLTETGALSEDIDMLETTDEDDALEDEVSLSTLTPKSASAAVSSGSGTVAMVADAPKARMGVGMIVAVTAGGVAGVALIAFGVGALFNLF